MRDSIQSAMRSLGWVICAALLLGSMGVSPVGADVPRLINYQGKLRDAGGGAVNGTVSIRFRLYNHITYTAPILFDETHASVSVTNGLFSAMIGSQAGGVSDAALSAAEVYLGVAIDAGAELSPRTRIVSGAHAIKARSAEQLVKPGTFDPAVSVDAAGLVGIGRTNPAVQLDIQGVSNTDSLNIRKTGGGIAVVAGLGAAGDGFLGLRDGSGNTTVQLYGSNASSSITSGNLGLGTDSPQSKLSFTGSGAANGILLGQGQAVPVNLYHASGGNVRTDNSLYAGGSVIADGSISAGSQLFVTRSSGPQFMTRYDATNKLDVSVTATGAVAFDSVGSTPEISFSDNVGIGTTNPGAKLHVAGTVRIADGTEGANKVLTSDASGNATWQSSGGTFTNYATLARGHASSNEMQQNQVDGLYRFQNDQFAYVVLKGVLPGDYDSGDVTVQAWFYIHDDNNTRKMTRYLSTSYPSAGTWTATTHENGVNFDITNNPLLTLTIPAAQVVPGGVVRLTMIRNGGDGGDNGGRLDFYAARLMYTARR